MKGITFFFQVKLLVYVSIDQNTLKIESFPHLANARIPNIHIRMDETD